MAETRFLVVLDAIAGEQYQGQKKPFKVLKNLPAKWRTEEGHDNSLIQLHTRSRIGLSTHDLMFDGSSGVNRTAEELVLKLLMIAMPPGSSCRTRITQSSESENGSIKKQYAGWRAAERCA